MDAEASVFDNVKFEKEKAMARFNRFRKIAKILQFLEVLPALMLISWSSTRLPRAVKLSGNFLFEPSGYLFNPHVVFLIENVIIVSLFVLCRKNDAGSHNSGSGDLYDDYLRHSEAQQRKVSVSAEDKNSSAQPEIKEITSASGAGGSDVEEKQVVRACSEEKAEQCDAMETAIETATKQIRKFQRTQSEKLKRDISVKPPGELRRSHTVTVRRRTEIRATTSFDSVDTLSNEDFNRKIDAVIKKHQEFLMLQKLAENE